MASVNESVVELLRQTTSGDTRLIKQATETLAKHVYPHKECLPALVAIATSCADAQIRQLAAVEARKRASVLWAALDTETQTLVKKQLLGALAWEPERLVARSLAGATAAVAAIEVPLGRWDDLPGFLYEAARSATTGARESALHLLNSLFDVLAERVGAEAAVQLVDLLAGAARDQGSNDAASLDVRVAAVQALGKAAGSGNATPVQHRVHEVLPEMLEVLRAAVASGREDATQRCIEVFDVLLLDDGGALARLAPELLALFAQVASDRNSGDGVRRLALNYLACAAVYHRSEIQRRGLTAPLVQAMLAVAAEGETDADAVEDAAADLDYDGDDDDDAVPGRTALVVIATAAANLPPRQVVPPLMDFARASFADALAPRARKAALMAVSVALGGASEFLQQHCGTDIAQLVRRGLADSHRMVRRAACMACASVVSAFGAGELCGAAAFGSGLAVVEALEAVLADPNPEVQRQALLALDVVLEGLDQPAAAACVARLAPAFVHVLNHGSVDAQVLAIGALGSLASAAEAAFQPFFEPAMARLQRFLVDASAETRERRSVATDTAAALMEAVGESGAVLVGPMIEAVLGGLELGDHRLCECSFVCFGVLARAFPSAVAPFLPQIVAAVLAGSAIQEAPGEASEDAAVAAVKETTADALGELFSALEQHFVSYLPRALVALGRLLEHYSESVRKAALGALVKFSTTAHRMDPASNAAQIVAAVPLCLLELARDEDDREVLRELCTVVAETLNEVGQAWVARDAEKVVAGLVELTGQLLSQEHECFHDDEDSGDDADPLLDASELDRAVITSAAELVCALANAFGADFAPAYRRLHPLLLQYYTPQAEQSTRCMALGCVGEALASLTPAGAAGLAQSTLPVVLCGLVDEDEEVRSNAAFAAGVVIETGGDSLCDAAVPVLERLVPLCVRGDGHAPGTADNACGAIARVILRHAALVPLPSVLPAFLAALPIQSDMAESIPVAQCLVALMQGGAASATPSSAARILQLLQHELGREPTDESDRLPAALLDAVSRVVSRG